MKSIDELKLREVKLWLEFVSRGVEAAGDPKEAAHVIRKRGWFCVAEFEAEDYLRVSDILLEEDANAGFAFLGRDADEHADTIAKLHSRGHEIVFHGHRHHSFADLSYDRAHEYLSTGLDRIEDATGVTPRGLFTPMSETSDGTLRALSELGLEWVLGTTDADVPPDDIALISPETPYDDHFFEAGDSPREVFDRFRQRATDMRTFVFHPPYHRHYDAADAFERWIADVVPVSVSEQLDYGGVGLVLDCARPIKAE